MGALIEGSDKLAYTVAEAAAATGLSDDTLYRKHHSGEITMRKAGRRTLIMAADVQALLAALPVLPRHAA